MGGFYTLYLLLVTGLLGISLTGDVFNLYVLIEIAAISSYGLLALGKGRGYFSTFNYLIMGSIGACFYLLGVGYLFIQTGTLNMADLFQSLVLQHGTHALLVAALFVMIGVWIKMAFFPFHGVVSNAYTFSPTAVTCLAAPLLTKVYAYVMIRLMFSVFSAQYMLKVLPWQPVVMAMASIGIIVGSLYALMQTDLRRMATYILVAELGYIVGGIWLGHQYGVAGALYHILSDAAMMLALFMVIGAIVYRTGSSSFDALKGACSQMRLEVFALILTGVAIVGIPPSCGFFSKWYLILGALYTQSWAFMGALLFASLTNAVLFYRLIALAYFESPLKKYTPSRALPLSMASPMIFSAAGLLLIGIFTMTILRYVVDYSIPVGMS